MAPRHPLALARLGRRDLGVQTEQGLPEVVVLAVFGAAVSCRRSGGRLGSGAGLWLGPGGLSGRRLHGGRGSAAQVGLLSSFKVSCQVLRKT